MHTKQKGDIAVTKVELELLKRGFKSLRPIGENTRYDLVCDVGCGFVRIQVKHMFKRYTGWILKARSTRINSKRKTISYPYTKKEVDILIGYRPDTEDCYIVPIEQINGKKEILINENTRRSNQFGPLDPSKFRNAWHLIK
jgi:hypothetical protein